MAIAASNEAGGPAARSALYLGLAELEECLLDELEPIRQALGVALDDPISSERSSDSRQLDRLIARTRKAERRYGNVQERLICLIARQAPVATDLRLALALLRVNYRIKRMHAQLADILSQRCAVPDAGRPSGAQLACLAVMAALVEGQIAAAGRAFSDRDAEGARRLRRDQGEIIRCNRHCFSLAVNQSGNETDREAAFCIMLMARALERLGSNAVDIAEQGRFVAQGHDRAIRAKA